MLEAALLDAAWQVLLDVGYDDFTFEAVAAAAGTSRVVLYRRWPAKPDLVRAAVVRAFSDSRLEYLDTGSLRGDLIAAFEQLNESRIRVGLELEAPLLQHFSGSVAASFRGASASERNQEHGRGRAWPNMDEVLQRGVDRREIDDAILTPRVRRLPLDLFRNEVIMTHQIVAHSAIESMVDEILIPILTGGHHEGRGSGSAPKC